MGKKITFTKDALGIISEAQFDAIVNSGWWRQGNGTAQQTFSSKAGDGGLHRFGVMAKISNNPAEYFRIETKEDWRDRLLLVSWAVGHPLAPSGFSSGFSSGFGGPPLTNHAAFFPGVSEEIDFTRLSEPVVMWTEAGESEPMTSLQPNAIELETGLFLYADSSNGDLIVNGIATLSDSYVGLVLLIHATDKLGEAGIGAPTSINEPAPSDGALVTPGELNALQDASLMEQFNGWDVDPNTNNAAVSMPLGHVVTGQDPAIPEEWDVAIRDGEITTSSGDPKTLDYKRRQRMAGGEVRRARGMAIATANAILVDNTIDWRDRYIYASGRAAEGDIRPGGASESSFNSESLWSGQTYTYVGKDITAAPTNTRHTITILSSLYLLVDQVTGALYVRNDVGATYYVCMIIQATPQLGTRREQS